MMQKCSRRQTAYCFPGQGQAREAMEYLKAHQLDQVIKNLKQPVLGICVGQQLLCRHSEEGDVDCIGIFDVDVKRFKPQKHEDKVPAMGWNEIYDLKTELYKGFGNRADAADAAMGEALQHPYSYFVHSYYVPLCEETIAKADYILPYSAIATTKTTSYLPVPSRKERKGRRTDFKELPGNTEITIRKCKRGILQGRSPDDMK